MAYAAILKRIRLLIPAKLDGHYEAVRRAFEEGDLTAPHLAMIRERVMAGLSRAKADGIQLGRRRLEDSDADKVAAIVAARVKGTGIRRIARGLGVGVGTVLRVTGADA
jgi:hypothetical protein